MKTISEIHKECHGVFSSAFCREESGALGQSQSTACNVFDKLTSDSLCGTDCLGENFNTLIHRVEEEWFTRYSPGENLDYYFMSYILLLYLFVERVDLVFQVLQGDKDKTVKIIHDFHFKNFPVLRRVNKWANFFKHPKEFLFTHWPSFAFEYSDEVRALQKELGDDPATKTTSDPVGPADRPEKVLVDWCFIKNHYFSENKPRPIVLTNNPHVVVAVPDLVKLTEDFGDEINLFFRFICENQLVADFLRKKSTIDDYFCSEVVDDEEG